MNHASSLQFQVQPEQLSVSWKCGDLVPHTSGNGTSPCHDLVDWSRKQLNASIVLDQVHLITQTAIHASVGIRSMLDVAHARALELCTERDPIAMTHIADDVDALLNQVDAMVMEASLGDVNLLGRRNGCWKLPYLLTEIQSAGHYHNLITIGVSVGAVREAVNGNDLQLVGLYALTTDESDSVCWIHSPAFWLQLQDDVAASDLKEEIERFACQLKQLQSVLSTMESQLGLYMKQVGEVITDLSFQAY